MFITLCHSDAKLLGVDHAYLIWESTHNNFMLQFTSKEEEIGIIELSEKYYQLDPEIISEWVEKAEVNEDEDITVTVSETRS